MMVVELLEVEVVGEEPRHNGTLSSRSYAASTLPYDPQATAARTELNCTNDDTDGSTRLVQRHVCTQPYGTTSTKPPQAVNLREHKPAPLRPRMSD